MRPPGLIAPPFSIGLLNAENLPKVKLGQVEVGSNYSKSLMNFRRHILLLFAPNSYENLTKNEIMSSRSWFLQYIAQNHSPRK